MVLNCDLFGVKREKVCKCQAYVSHEIHLRIIYLKDFVTIFLQSNLISSFRISPFQNEEIKDI